MKKLLAFLEDLNEKGFYYTLGHHREETVMVTVCIPGEHWEVEFFEDGRVEVEVFRSGEGLEGEEAVSRLLEEDDETVVS